MAELAARRCRPMLGTLVEIAVPEGCDEAIDAAFSAIAHVHARMSFHEDRSDLAALRRVAPGQIVEVDPDTVAVLRIAADLHERSGGLFDISVGARLVAAGYLPRPAGTDLRAMTGRTSDIEIVDERRLRCHRPMLIDLGGIAKGYAVDRAAEALSDRGVDRAIVNAGGDLRVVGDDSQRVHLCDYDGGVEAAVEIADMALATSAARWERRRHRGRATSPHLGARRSPVVPDLAVSVVAPTCVVADAMTKVALADPSLAAAMLAGLGGEIVSRSHLEEAA